MPIDSRTLTLQSCRHCGAGAPTEVHFCPQCERILTLNRHGDYFTFFGLPRKLNIELAELERRFRSLSRQFHPDYYYNSSQTERLASLERSSYLNDAYRVLRDPLDRVEYLLKLEGVPPSGRHQDPSQLAPGMLEQVFALNEELDEVRLARAAGATPSELASRVSAAKAPIEERAVRQEEELRRLSSEWDALVARQAPADERRAALEALRGLVHERSYIANLLQTVAREVGASS